MNNFRINLTKDHTVCAPRIHIVYQVECLHEDGGWKDYIEYADHRELLGGFNNPEAAANNIASLKRRDLEAVRKSALNKVFELQRLVNENPAFGDAFPDANSALAAFWDAINGNN